MNQGKLEVVKQETARVNVDILGICKLKWTGMGKFNSDDHYIYYHIISTIVSKNPFLSHHSQQKSPKWVLGCNLKNDSMISVHFQGKPFNITVIQMYAPTTNAKKAEVKWFYGGVIRKGNGTPLQYSCLENPMDRGDW